MKFWTVRIKKIRTEVLRLNQEQLAEKINCSQENLSLIECGGIGKQFIPLLTYFAEQGINLNYIFKEDNEFESVFKKEEEGF